MKMNRLYFFKYMQEIWKDIKGYEDQYQVSNFGRVKSLERDIYSGSKFNRKCKEMYLKLMTNNHGYLVVDLMKCNKKKRISVHTLVSVAFLGHNPNVNKMVVNHKDFDKKNNNLSNLEVITYRENSIHYAESITKHFVGVTYMKSTGKYIAQIKINGKRNHLGCFDTAKEASNFYQKTLILLKQGKEIEFYKIGRGISKYVGVNFIKRTKTWRARYTYNKKEYNIGNFKTEYQAHLAYESFKKTLSMDKNLLVSPTAQVGIGINLNNIFGKK